MRLTNSFRVLSLLFGAFMLASQTASVQGFKRCYTPFGCFSATQPYTALFGLPKSPSLIKTRAIFHSEQLSSCSVELQNGFDILKVKGKCFKANRETKVIVHGAFESSTQDWVQELTRKFLASSSVNVIVIDWRSGAAGLFQLGGNIRLVARQLAFVIYKLINEPVLNPSQVHMIGFSAGAYVVGQAGQILSNERLQIRRITGLDPPKPVYLLLQTDSHPMNLIYRNIGLDDTDASFVDVIHTDTDFVGIKDPIGHVDFYPNGGNNQPDCEEHWATGLSNFLACDHVSAPGFFNNAISSPCLYKVTPCPTSRKAQLGNSCEKGAKNTTYMGLKADESRPKRKPVAYYIDTKAPQGTACS